MLELPKFQNRNLLLQALTHRSYSNESPESEDDNQRLEFLGDCVLGFLVGAMLYEYFPDLPEGELTRRRSALVDELNLTHLARELELGSKLRIGKGTERDGGRDAPSLLSDAFEAIIGAYFLDSGIDAVKLYVEQVFTPLIRNAPQYRSPIDAKSQLQEWVQSNFNGSLPEYRTVSASGQDHAKVFTVEVWIGDKCYGTGTGRSKKNAEKQAATDALSRLS
ncbi:ribonuclease III [Pseudanabaena sp. PCC 6802]|uniref:ribonuclease III n=1 Tax=Pseudanabaena sp. PCC 6802 TaxID=118173 RepID=UPI00034C17D7|nr:ribonuclease III [Pseudanabaena sp. PCC 6802]